MIDILNIAARKKLGAGEDWHWCESEAITGGFLLTGSITKTGPRTGRPQWVKPMQKVLISDSEIETVKAEFESATGKCYQCEGTAQELYGWSKAEGARYRPCKRCGATGVPPVAVK